MGKRRVFLPRQRCSKPESILFRLCTVRNELQQQHILPPPCPLHHPRHYLCVLSLFMLTFQRSFNPAKGHLLLSFELPLEKHVSSYLDKVVWKESPLPLARPLPPAAVHLLHAGDDVARADRQLVGELSVVVEFNTDFNCGGKLKRHCY